ncbi:MAG: type II toxin-antitoxin system HicB family antitoxin [Tannerella sp.]|jgi:predicted RNase H-like HicB family nuclease|nr:type II toxin-antitoxin system HicB family antitoxin [Tannerella sp.]
MKLKAIIERWDDGTYSIYVSNAKKHNLNAQGKTVDEARRNLQAAVDDYVQMYSSMGKPVPREISNPEFDYHYDLASFFNYFDYLNISALARKAHINASLMRQYKTRRAFASEQQSKRIQGAINILGKEMAAAQL